MCMGSKWPPFRGRGRSCCSVYLAAWILTRFSLHTRRQSDQQVLQTWRDEWKEKIRKRRKYFLHISGSFVKIQLELVDPICIIGCSKPPPPQKPNGSKDQCGEVRWGSKARFYKRRWKWENCTNDARIRNECVSPTHFMFLQCQGSLVDLKKFVWFICKGAPDLKSIVRRVIKRCPFMFCLKLMWKPTRTQEKQHQKLQSRQSVSLTSSALRKIVPIWSCTL